MQRYFSYLNRLILIFKYTITMVTIMVKQRCSSESVCARNDCVYIIQDDSLSPFRLKQLVYQISWSHICSTIYRIRLHNMSFLIKSTINNNFVIDILVVFLIWFSRYDLLLRNLPLGALQVTLSCTSLLFYTIPNRCYIYGCS